MPKVNPKRAIREKFHKRKRCCLKKAHELGHLCQAEVYVAIYRNGRWYTYSSSREPQWPPPDYVIVRLNVSILENVYAYAQQQGRQFPPPERKYPVDFNPNDEAASKASDVVEQKDFNVTQMQMEDRSTANPWSEQKTKVSMPPVLQLSPLLERASGQETDHEFDCILAK